MINKLFQAKIILGQGARATKTQTIVNLYKGVSKEAKTVSKGPKTKLHLNEKSKDVPYKETNDNTKLRNDLGKRQHLIEELKKDNDL